MRKIVRNMLLFCLIMCICKVSSYANYEKVNVYVDGKPLVTDQPGIILNNRTLVPLRAICEALDCKVSWDEKNNEAEVSNDAVNVRIKINSYYMIKSYKAFHNDLKEGYVDDSYVDYYEEIEIDVPPIIINNRTLIPVRAISEAIYADVKWNEKNQSVEITRKYDKISGFSEDVARIKKDNKCGFIDMKGNIIIPLEYDYALDFENDVVVIQKSEKYGLIDKEGHISIPVEYDSLLPLSFKYAKLASTIARLPNNMQWDNKDNLLMALKNKKWGIINTKGDIEVPFVYDAVFFFSEGLAMVMKDDKWGAINTKGDIIISLEYDDITPVENGLYLVEKNEKVGMINTNGEIEIPIEYNRPFMKHSDNIIMISKDEKVGYIDKQGNVLIPFEYDLCIYNDGYILACKNKKWGMIDINENIMMPFTFDWMCFFGNGMELLKTETLSNGTLSFTPESNIVVLKDSQYGIIDRQGNIVVPIEYDEITYISNNLAGIKKGDKWGVVNMERNIVLPIEYDEITYISNNLAGIKKGDKWGVVNMEGSFVIPIEYDSIQKTKAGKYLKVENNGEIFYYDNFGNIIYQPINE